MSLLSLPAELVRQILHVLDPASFYQCLQTSRLFREHALASTNLLHEQLARIPGQRSLQPDVASNTAALMSLFGRRAAQHLVTGVSRMADMTQWKAPPCMDRKISSIVRLKDDRYGRSPTASKPSQDFMLLLEVRSKEVTVNIHCIRMADQNEDLPRLLHIIAPNLAPRHLPFYDEQGPSGYCVVKMATCNLRTSGFILAVLYSPKRLPTKFDAVVDLKAICYSVDMEFGPRILRGYDVTASKYSQAVAMAVTPEGDPIIVWRTRDSDIDQHEVVNYVHILGDTMSRPRTTSRSIVLYEHARITDISVQGSTIHLYPSTIPLPKWSAPLNVFESEDSFAPRDTHLPDVLEAFSNHALGRTIAHHHHHMIEMKHLNNGEHACVNTALELMISRDVPSHPYMPKSRRGAFLLKALHYPETCEEFDTTLDYHNLNHVFVAQLGGLPDLHNLSTLGLKLAVSPRAHRIAIASWRTLLIYSLDPKAFLDPAYGLSGEDGVPGDHVFIEGCGWQYYSNGRFYRECVMLEPVEVKCEGVIFGLEWRDEDELWGIAEQGVVRWRIGVQATGKRETVEMVTA